MGSQNVFVFILDLSSKFQLIWHSVFDAEASRPATAVSVFFSATMLKVQGQSLLTLLHSERPKLWSFGRSDCNRVKYFGLSNALTFKQSEKVIVNEQLLLW